MYKLLTAIVYLCYSRVRMYIKVVCLGDIVVT